MKPYIQKINNMLDIEIDSFSIYQRICRLSIDLRLIKAFGSFIMFSLLLSSIDAKATNYYVNNASFAEAGSLCSAVGGTWPTNTGTSSKPLSTIQAVFDNYSLTASDVIYVDPGTYTESVITPGTNDIGFTIQGVLVSGSQVSIFDGTAIGYSWMYLPATENDNISIKDLKVQNYTAHTIASNEGGGFLRSKIGTGAITGLSIDNCIIDNCDGDAGQFGGAICIVNQLSPSITITNSTIKNSNAPGGAGGGAIYITATGAGSGPTTTITKCKFYSNTTGGDGSAIAFSGNGAASATITNSLFYSNSISAVAKNGVIYTDANTTLNMINCTVYGNSAQATCTAGLYTNTTANIKNCILYSNSYKDAYEANTTLTLTNCCYGVQYSAVLTNCLAALTDPLIIGSGDYHLSSTSPCINAGISSGAPSDDLDALSRIGLPDIGCYEYACPEYYSGTYEIGTGGGAKWATLTAALAALKTCMIDDVILELQDGVNYTDASETYPLDFSNLPTSASVTLTIRPKSTVNAVITLDGSDATALLSFNGTHYVTIDGRAGGTGTTKYLTIENTNSTGGSTFKLYNDATNNTIKYCTVKSNYGDNGATTPTIGTIFFGDGIASGTGNIDNIIDHCLIDGTATNADPATVDGVGEIGIYSISTTSPSNSNTIRYTEFKNQFIAQSAHLVTRGIYLATGNTGWTISNNYFYNTVSRAPAASQNGTYAGIEISSGNAYSITNNLIGGTDSTASGTWTVAYTGANTAYYTFMGMKLALGVATVSNIQGNTIKNISITSRYHSSNYWKGIYVTSGLVNIGTTSGNTIGSSSVDASSAPSISFLASNTYVSKPVFSAIDVATAVGSTSDIRNNVIGGIATHNASGFSATLNGIVISGAGTITANSNTIGSASQANNIYVGGASTAAGVSTFYGITSSCTGITTISNNTIGNIKAYGTGASTIYAIYNSGLSAATSAINSNVITTLSLPTTGTTTTATFTGIYNAAAAAITIQSNSISAITLNNGYFCGINDNVAATGTHTISSNTIGSSSTNDINVATSASIINYGIYVQSTGTYTISSNTIQNITSSGDPGVGNANNIYGIDCYSTGAYTLRSNFIKTLKSTNTSDRANVVAGIYFFYSGGYANSSTTCDKNLIRNLEVAAVRSSYFPYLYGIYYKGYGAGTQNLTDNLIYIDNGSNSGAITIEGICMGVYGTGPTCNMFYNTIYIGGGETGASHTAIWAYCSDLANSFGALNVKNNVFINTRTSTNNSARTTILKYNSSVNFYNSGTVDPFISNYGWSTSSSKYVTKNDGTNNTATEWRGLSICTSEDNNDNKAQVTVSTDGSLSDMSVVVGTTDGHSLVVDDIFGNPGLRNTNPYTGAHKGCYEASCITISSQPNAGTICVGGTYSPSVTATASLGAISYQWQYSTDNNSYSNVANGTPTNATYSNATTNNVSFTGNVAAGSGYYLRCVVSSTGCSSANSNGAQLTINAVPSISVQPSSGSICVGGTYSPSLTATGGTSKTYQWQYATSSGGSYSNVADATPANSTYSNGTTNNMSVTGSIAAGSGYWYKCIVSDAGSGCSSVTSNEVQLTVNSVPSISVQPSDATISVGGTYSPSITASGGVSLSYQWTYCATSGGTYNNVADATPTNATYSNATTNNMSATGSIAAGTYYYKCIVNSTGSGCSSVTSNYGTLTITSGSTVFYFDGSGNMSDINNWGDNATDGSGSHPVAMTTDGYTFNVYHFGSNITPSTNADWTLGSGSKIIVGNGTNPTDFRVFNAIVGTIDVSANATLTIANTTIPTLGTIDPTSTVDYAALGAQNVTSTTYGNLIISGGSNYTKTLAGNITATGNLSIAANTIFDTKSGFNYNITLGGNWTNNGTFTYRTGTVTLNGTNQNISASSFYNLTSGGSGTKTLTGNVAVRNTLDFAANSLIETGANTLTIGYAGVSGSITNYNSSRYIIAYDNSGTIGKVIRYLAADASYLYPIGDATRYTPFTFLLNSHGGNLSDAYLTVYTLASKVAGLNSALTNYIDRSWNYTQSGLTTPNYNLTLVYDNTDIHVGTDESKLLPIKKSGTTWYVPTESNSLTGVTEEGSGSVNVATNTLSWSGLSTFSDVGGAGDQGVALPVKLISFSAKCDDDKIEVEWTTASEQNSDYFVIERSEDLETWITLGSKNAAGNSNFIQKYSYNDISVQKGIKYYYRLRQVDFNGDYEYFGPIQSQCIADEELRITSVNVIGEKLEVKIACPHEGEELLLEIKDVNGQNVVEKRIFAREGMNTIGITNVKLKVGVYMVTIDNGVDLISLKFIMQ